MRLEIPAEEAGVGDELEAVHGIGRRAPRSLQADDDGRARYMREKKSREGGEGDKEEEQRSWRPAMGMLLLEAARRWSSCSWTTGGSGHEQGTLCLEAKHSIHRDARAAARKIRDLVGGCGWWGWIPRGRMRAVAARMELGGWDG